MGTKKRREDSDLSRIMFVDDHPLVRRGLAELISDEPDLEVCAEAADGEEALRVVDEVEPDLVVVDISLKGINGLELIKRIRVRNPKIRMLVSSMHDESLFAERALRAGAMGYVNKEQAPEEVIEAIHRVLAGDVYLSSEMTNRLLHGIVAGRETTGPSSIESLSDRELEVFGLIGRGLTTREIANRLHLSVKTVETHRDHIRTKLKAETTAELTCRAVQWVLENG